MNNVIEEIREQLNANQVYFKETVLPIPYIDAYYVNEVLDKHKEEPDYKLVRYVTENNGTIYCLDNQKVYPSFKDMEADLKASNETDYKALYYKLKEIMNNRDCPNPCTELFVKKLEKENGVKDEI